jgi:hypothetical protein
MKQFERPPGSGFWFDEAEKPLDETIKKMAEAAKKISEESEAKAFEALEAKEAEEAKDKEIAALKEALAQSHEMLKAKAPVAPAQNASQSDAKSVASEKEAPKK